MTQKPNRTRVPVNITFDREVLRRLDEWCKHQRGKPSRSQVVEDLVVEMLDKEEREGG